MRRPGIPKWRSGRSYDPGETVLHDGVEYLASAPHVGSDAKQVTTVLVSAPTAITPMIIGRGVRLRVVVSWVDPVTGRTEPLSNRHVTWSSSAPLVASVDDAGYLTAHAVGSFTITATAEGVAGTITGTVALAYVNSIYVTPSNLTVMLGAASAQLAATAFDASGETMPDAPLTYASSNTAVATVSPTGLVTIVGAGVAAITVANGPVFANVSLTVGFPVHTVTVTPATFTLTEGDTIQLSAVTRAVNNSLLAGRSITWSLSDVAVAHISPTGLLTALTDGTVTVTAASEGKIGTVDGTITAAGPPAASVPTSITLTPASAVIASGETRQFAADVRDQHGDLMIGESVVWGVAPLVATTVLISGPTDVVTGSAPAYTAEVRDQHGQPFDANVTWSSNAPATMSINPTTGVGSPSAAGSVVITASVNDTSVTATRAVTITSVVQQYTSRAPLVPVPFDDNGVALQYNTATGEFDYSPFLAWRTTQISRTPVAGGTTHYVTPANWETVLTTTAEKGDVIVFENYDIAGAEYTFSSTKTLRALTRVTDRLLLLTTQHHIDGTFPIAAGTLINPDVVGHREALARIRWTGADNPSALFSTALNASGYAFEGLYFYLPASSYVNIGDVLRLGEGATATTQAQMGSRFAVMHCLFGDHAVPTIGTKRRHAMVLSGTDFYLRDNTVAGWVGNTTGDAVESKAVAMWEGAGRVFVDGLWARGCAIPFMVGGATGDAGTMPSDLVFRRFFSEMPENIASWAFSKNGWELKKGRRVIVEVGHIKGVTNTGGQGGIAWNLKTSTGSTNDVNDACEFVYINRIWAEDVGAGPKTAPRPDGQYGTPLNSVHTVDVLIDHIQRLPMFSGNGDGVGFYGSSSNLLADVVYDYCGFVGGTRYAMIVEGTAPAGGVFAGCAVRNSFMGIVPGATAGIRASSTAEGAASMTGFDVQPLTNVLLYGLLPSAVSLYPTEPTNTYTSADLLTVNFADPKNRDYTRADGRGPNIARLLAAIDTIGHGKTIGPAPLVPTTVVITPAGQSLNSGETTTVTATVRDQWGDLLPGANVVLTSSAPGIVAVNVPSGDTTDVNGESTFTISWVSAGSATLTATVGSATTTASATANAPGDVVLALVTALGGDAAVMGIYDTSLGVTTGAGSVVSSWRDYRGASGYGPALTQSTAARQPVLSGDAILFDGVDDNLYNGATFAGFDMSARRLALVVVGTMQSTAATKCLAGISDGSVNQYMTLMSQSSGGIKWGGRRRGWNGSSATSSDKFSATATDDVRRVAYVGEVGNTNAEFVLHDAAAVAFVAGHAFTAHATWRLTVGAVNATTFAGLGSAVTVAVVDMDLAALDWWAQMTSFATTQRAALAASAPLGGARRPLGLGGGSNTVASVDANGVVTGLASNSGMSMATIRAHVASNPAIIAQSDLSVFVGTGVPDDHYVASNNGGTMSVQAGSSVQYNFQVVRRTYYRDAFDVIQHTDTDVTNDPLVIASRTATPTDAAVATSGGDITVTGVGVGTTTMSVSASFRPGHVLPMTVEFLRTVTVTAAPVPPPDQSDFELALTPQSVIVESGGTMSAQLVTLTIYQNGVAVGPTVADPNGYIGWEIVEPAAPAAVSPTEGQNTVVSPASPQSAGTATLRGTWYGAPPGPGGVTTMTTTAPVTVVNPSGGAAE